VTAQDFAEGEKLRASVQYTIDTSIGKKRAQVQQNLDQQSFAAALEASADGLKLDNENRDLLYDAALNACVLRHCDKAEPSLRRYFDITDSTQRNRDKRLGAMQLLANRSAGKGRQNRRKLPRPVGFPARHRPAASSTIPSAWRFNPKSPALKRRIT
jgi:hypothetical protein